MKFTVLISAAILVSAGAAFAADTDPGTAGASATETNSEPTVIYVAHLHPLNTKVTGLETTGEARFSIAGDKLTISVNAQKLPPNMMHLQHFHGFKDNRDATCPTEAADKNHDGIIDLIETEPTSGTTMVPFHDDPVSMEIVRDTYPKAGADGTFQYQKTVSLKDLEAAFAKAFGDKELDLDRRVVFIHGILPSTKLPASVASLGTIPAQVTLPIACGKIERVEP
jgi:hypothetical protein